MLSPGIVPAVEAPDEGRRQPLSRRSASGLAEVRDPAQGGQVGHEQVLAAAQHVERLDAVDATPNRLLRDCERRPAPKSRSGRTAPVSAHLHASVLMLDSKVLRVSRTGKVSRYRRPIGVTAPDDSVD